MIWIVILLTFICLINFIVINRYTKYYDRKKEIALYVLAILYLILELGILIYMVSNKTIYRCEVLKVDTIKE